MIFPDLDWFLSPLYILSFCLLFKIFFSHLKDGEKEMGSIYSLSIKLIKLLLQRWYCCQFKAAHSRRNACTHFVRQLNFYCGYKTASLCYSKHWIPLHSVAFPTDLFVCLLIALGKIQFLLPWETELLLPSNALKRLCVQFLPDFLSNINKLISDLLYRTSSFGSHFNIIFPCKSAWSFGSIFYQLSGATGIAGLSGFYQQLASTC